MKNFSTACVFILLSAFLVIPHKSVGQSADLSINAKNLFPGYQEKLKGETAGFHSDNPNVNDVLVARCDGRSVGGSWKTSAIPVGYHEKYLYFVWVSGLATGKNRQNSSYQLSINNTKAFEFKVLTEQPSQNWTVKGENGAELSFRQHWKDDNGDCFGFMYLKVPVKSFQKGKALTLEVNGIDSKRYDDFYMTFLHEVKEDATVSPRLLLRQENGQLQQLIAVQVNHILPAEATAVLQTDDGVKQQVKLKSGYNEIELWVPAVKTEKNCIVNVTAAGILAFKTNIKLQPVSRRELYLVNHSHNDIGYSDLQTVVAQKQNDYIRQAIQLIEKTKDYPEGAKFIWHVEAAWAVENFMTQASPEEKEKLVKYAREGSIALPVGYANLLTGICRPEELIHLTDYADTLQRKYGIQSKSLMISDVPGMSWNIVSALAQRGVKYLASAPNYIPHDGFPDVGGRVGATHRAWGDKPFYWVSASGADTILYWQAGTGYSWFQDWNMGRLRFEHKPMGMLMDYLQKLQDNKYPYEMVQLSYSVINDNSKPDEGISDFVAEWNKKYVSPKMVITNVDDMMKTFVRRYNKKIPVFAGDFTPYWEDGAMSTAREEGLVKQSVERLYQSSVLNTLFFPGTYNSDKYYKAWRDAVLWHEHTWGAWNSISAPDEPNVVKQWEYKQNFALQIDTLSKQLLHQKLDTVIDQKNEFRVMNTSSWNRTDIVILSKSQSLAGDNVVDEKGARYPSQRLTDGSLAFLAKDVPALGSKKFYNKKGKSVYQSKLKISGDLTISNEAMSLKLDKTTGAIKSLINNKTGMQFVDSAKYKGLNQYLYMPGLDPAKAETVSNVQIKIKENGPLIASFEVTATAPGSDGLRQEIWLVNELDRVNITDVINKKKIRAKESVHLAFPVNVKNGQMRMDLGTGILIPGKNQLPGANKDYFSMQRWADVSNENTGLTFITNEVPLIEQGELVNELPYASSNNFGGQSVEKKWKDTITPSNTFFAYAMNNYWYTNSKADQEGLATFHYSIYLHDAFNEAKASREGRSAGQPLLISANKSDVFNQLPFILNDENILLTSIKPSISGKGIVIRLYNASATNQQLHFEWNKVSKATYSKIYLTDASENKLVPFDTSKAWPAFAIKTLYIE